MVQSHWPRQSNSSPRPPSSTGSSGVRYSICICGPSAGPVSDWCNPPRSCSLVRIRLSCTLGSQLPYQHPPTRFVSRSSHPLLRCLYGDGAAIGFTHGGPFAVCPRMDDMNDLHHRQGYHQLSVLSLSTRPYVKTLGCQTRPDRRPSMRQMLRILRVELRERLSNYLVSVFAFCAPYPPF